MSSTAKSWAKSASPEFFTLNPSVLSNALIDAMPMDKMSADQQLYARAVLLHIASDSVNTMHEEARVSGGLAARKASPAYSLVRVGEYEDRLYNLIEKGDVDAVKLTTKRQKITSTAHPNFSRSRALVQKCSELSAELATFTREEQMSLEENNVLPPEHKKRVSELLADMTELMAPRKKRSRRDELQETALDLIPTAMNAASEQVEIYKRRSALLGRVEFDDYQVQTEEYEREVDGKMRKGKVISTSGTAKPHEFKSIKQLEAVAALFPEYNNWFLDGDGKRTCHVYDAELAIPAVKRATYQEYIKLLDKLPDRFDGMNVAGWRRKLTDTVKVLSGIEELAAKRLDAFNDLHEKYRNYRDDTQDIELRDEYRRAQAAAEEASLRYKKKLSSKSEVEGKTVIEVMQGDEASQLRAQLGSALDKIYSHSEHAERPYKETAEDLYMKLTAFGNFTVHMQRRENAQQYKETFEFLLQNNLDIKKKLSTALGVDEGDIIADIEDKPALFSKAVEVMAASAADPADPLGMREAIAASYKRLAHKLEKIVKDPQGEKMVMKPLESREFLALDGLGFYNMGKLYPEAFKGGYVIAEFAQPDIDVLREGSEDEIRSEVKRLARTDTLLQIAFSNAMGASWAPIIPLHEDPATMKYAPDAQAALREEPMIGYFLKHLGISNAEEAEAKAVRFINEKGELELLTAYQNLQRFGATDEELVQKGHNIAELKRTYVLEGPDDMEACSDIDKRSTNMGSEEAKQSVREKAIEASKYPIQMGDKAYTIVKSSVSRDIVNTEPSASSENKKQYVILKPKYMGQGGAIARSTKIAIDTQQATWQGEQLASLSPKSIAHMSYNNMLGRLYLNQEAAIGQKPSEAMYDLAAEKPFHTGNALGLPGNSITAQERELIDATISARISATRDDPRYNVFLIKYGEPAPNYSARPDAKSGKKETFNSGRAIGIAAKEAGIWSNVIGVAEMFDVGTRGEGKGEITQASILEVRKWKRKDPYIQQMLTAGALVANFVNLEEKWARGGITYHEDAVNPTLTKKGATVLLRDLQDAYDHKQSEYKDPKTGAVFDAGDLVMAHLTEQFHKLEKGLLAVYNKKDVLNLFEKEHQPTIMAYKELYDHILTRLRETKPGKDEPKSKDRELLEGAYYVLFEGGNGIYPLDSLLEKRMHEQAAAPVNSVAV